MSFTFTIHAPEGSVLTFGALQRATGTEVGSVEGLGPDDPVRGLLNLYRPRLTTRAIEVDAGESELSVRILTCSSVEDHELAVAVVEIAAAHRGASLVEPEADDPIPTAELRRRYDPAWAAREVASAATIVINMVDQNPGKLITLNGPIRPFHAGGRLVAELRASGPPEGLGDRFVVAMRRTQWPGDAFAASILAVSGGPSGKQTRLAVLTGRARTLLPDVDAVALHEPDESLYVPPAVVRELLPEDATYLDERHLLVESVDEARWAAFIRAARPRAIDIDSL
jgi:hypothetical protein